MKKVTYLVISILLLLFAIVQLNDTDGWKWFLAYIVPSILFALLYFSKYFEKPAKLLLITYGCVSLLYVPDFFTWAKDGFPTIVDSMQAQTPYIEFVREFFGLIILLASMIYYLRLKSVSDDLAPSESS